MAELLNAKLFNQKKEMVNGEGLKDKIIGVYYSAHWCPPCRMFTPVLKDFYTALKAANANFEIIFVSCDQSDDQMWSYFKNDHGDYLVVDYESPVREEIMGTHGVSGIPALIIMKGDGTLITTDGRQDVTTHKGAPAQALEKWSKA